MAGNSAATMTGTVTVISSRLPPHMVCFFFYLMAENERLLKEKHPLSVISSLFGRITSDSFARLKVATETRRSMY